MPQHPNNNPKPPPKYQRQAEKTNADQRRRHAALTPAQKLERVWRSAAKPPVPKVGGYNFRDSRKVTLAQAFMPWSDLAEAFRIYMAAAVLSELFGEPYVVDHLVPLNHPLVCGLHVHCNLKSNLFWPQMAAIEWGSFVFLLGNP